MRALGRLFAWVTLAASGRPIDACTDDYYQDKGNGFCDIENNVNVCMYDGGDCCPSTCVSTAEHTCLSETRYCADPSATDFAEEYYVRYENCTGIIEYISSVVCTPSNNNVDCGYDGGDCCPSTCVSTAQHNCSVETRYCADPSTGEFAEEYYVRYENCTGIIEYIGSSSCEHYNNNAGCGYDEGDCCPSTCGSTENCPTNPNFCADPAANDHADSFYALYGNCMGSIELMATGYCTFSNNNADCGYDGGDCCPSTCASSEDYLCSTDTRYCADPSASDFANEYYSRYQNCSGTIEHISNGNCSAENNNLECGYDGGDCCPSTCVEDCTVVDVRHCVDLNATDYNPNAHSDFSAAYPSCEDVSQVADGICNAANNGPECGYDGGDCCACTCRDPSGSIGCWDNTYDCADPDAANVAYGCRAPPTLSPCSSDIAPRWVVSDTVSARQLAMAVNCSGGTFEVEWKGTVKVDQTIGIYDGTEVSIAGVGEDATADGMGVTQLFTMINASLHLTNMTISNGAGQEAGGGGGMSAARSHITLSMATFVNNSANTGGALLAIDNSDVSCVKSIFFSENTAATSGGALYLGGNSRFSCTGQSTFFNNSATYSGSACYVEGMSTALWGGETTFMSNEIFEMLDGERGTVYVTSMSTATWTGDTILFVGNIGGALNVADGATVRWTGRANFSSNHRSGFAHVTVNEGSVSWSGPTAFAGTYGVRAEGSTVFWSGEANFTDRGNKVEYSEVGWNTTTRFVRISGCALYATRSNVSWSGETVFADNHSGGWNSGALNLWNANVSWSAKTTFVNNTSSADQGGAVGIFFNSSVSWSGDTDFINNKVYAGGEEPSGDGGALALDDYSEVSWSGRTHFFNNTAPEGRGGAVYALRSTVHWTGETTFERNTAAEDGGSVNAWLSDVSWSGNTLFIDCTADVNGGALYVATSSRFYWSGETTFVNNTALGNGGAIADYKPNSDSAIGNIVVNGSTTFRGNNCGRNGGALAIIGDTQIAFKSQDVEFVKNTADSSGGAVYISGSEVGVTFPGVKFVSNFAQVGGAVYVLISGTAVTKDPVTRGDVEHPTTFRDSIFLDNRAVGTGGAIESIGGKDTFVGSWFRGNTATAGGSVRIGGSTSVVNCSFVDNSASVEGLAISNIGSMQEMTNSTFRGNFKQCPKGEFFGTVQGERYGEVCSNCMPLASENASVDDPDYANYAHNINIQDPTAEPACKEALEHTTSSGVGVKLETLIIEAGFWRATNTSTILLECYNTEACEGGITGSVTFCKTGYTGPYCSVCTDGYGTSVGFTCNKCSDARGGGIALAVVTAVLMVVAAFGVLAHMLEKEGDQNRGASVSKRISKRIKQWVPLQMLKIVLVAWQIISQFSDVANAHYPDVYERFLNVMDYFNFDLGWVLSTGCILDFDFHDRLLTSTIGPLVVIALLGCTYAVAMRRADESATPRAMQVVRQKHMSMLLLVTFLVYSSVSAMIFRMFACEALDDEKTYLTADYRIECDSPKHRRLQIYSAFMVIIYPIGIPLLYAVLLFQSRADLKVEATRGRNPRVQLISDLWQPYTPQCFYYEVVECGRRIMLTGVVVFIFPNTAAQIAITLVLAFAFYAVLEILAPYASSFETWTARTGHVVVFFSMYVALLLRVDVSQERTVSQGVFAGVLVAAHVCMIVAVVAECCIMAWSLKEKQARQASVVPKPSSTEIPPPAARP